MQAISKLVVVTAFVTVASAAHAFTFFNLASGDLGLTGQNAAGILTVGGPPVGVQSDTTNGTIDFFPGSGIVVGDSSGRGFEAYSFTYQVAAPSNVANVGLVLQGVIGGTGLISVEEDIFRINADNSETLVGSIANTLSTSGTNVNRGTYNLVGSTYSYQDVTALFPNLQNYKVKKSFFLQVTDFGTPQFNPAVDFAAITLIQQSHQPVPEPATMATLLVGAAAIAARRRRKS